MQGVLGISPASKLPAASKGTLELPFAAGSVNPDASLELPGLLPLAKYKMAAPASLIFCVRPLSLTHDAVARSVHSGGLTGRKRRRSMQDERESLLRRQRRL